VRAVLTATEKRGPDETPTDILLRALRDVGEAGDDMVGRMAALRLRLIRTVPAVRGRALQLQQDGQAEIAQRLHAAFPDQLGRVEAAALVGAFIGAVTGALQVLLGDDAADPGVLRERLQRATTVALRPWSAGRARSPNR
jgi:hypothetical protein